MIMITYGVECVKVNNLMNLNQKDYGKIYPGRKCQDIIPFKSTVDITKIVNIVFLTVLLTI